MARIFISYRREDSDIWVSRLVDELRRHFPADQVFQDVASIDPGADFIDALDKALGTAAVMLAVIGPGWLSATDRQGRRRLDLPGDFVRQEIAESLRRPGVRVFPLLVGGAEMPSEEDLPDPLKELHLRQAFELTVRHWHNDVAQLVQTLKRVTAPSEDPGAVQEAARQKAEEEARHREAEARAAQDEAERRAAAEQARKEAEEERRRVEEEARQKTAEEKARRKAAEEEAQRKRAGEEARRKAAQETAERESPGSKLGWKVIAGVGAIVAAVTLLVVVGVHEPEPSPKHAPAVEPAPPAPKPAPAVEAKPSPPDTRRLVVSGPKPLYAPFKTGDVFQECAECPEMVVIVPDPKGFTIGSPESEQGRETDEKQFEPIRFSKPYAIGKFEVTRAQFKASGVQPSGGCYTWDSKNSKWQLDPKRNWEQPGFDQGPDHPVVCVSWDEVQEYLRWINRQVGSSGKDLYRLPSEAEWEYAARGGTTIARFWGNEPEQACDYANVADRTAKKTFPNWSIHECSDGFVYTAPVGRFTANQYGLKDMIGNVRNGSRTAMRSSTAQVSEMARHSRRRTAACGWCAVAPGAAYRSSPASRTATGTYLRTGSSAGVFASPGRSDLLGLYLFTS